MSEVASGVHGQHPLGPLDPTATDTPMTEHAGWEWYTWRVGVLLLAALTVSLSLIHDGLVNSFVPFFISVAIALGIGTWCSGVALEKGFRQNPWFLFGSVLPYVAVPLVVLRRSKFQRSDRSRDPHPVEW